MAVPSVAPSRCPTWIRCLIRSPTSTSTPSSRCSTGRPASTRWWPRPSRDGQPAIGITDHGNMYGTLEFYKECNKQGIKPIIGTEAYMAHDHRSERPARRGRVDDSGGDTEGGKKLYYHLTLLAENDTGYKNLIQLGEPGVHGGLLLQAADGLGAAREVLRRADRHHRLPRRPRAAVAAATATIRRRSRRRPGCRTSSAATTCSSSCRTTASPPSTRPTRSCSRSPRRSRRRSSPPTTATTPTRSDHEAHDALLCVQTGALLSDPNRFRFEGSEHYLKTAAEMRYLFRELPQACDNTLWIAERADVDDRVRQAAAAQLPAAGGLRRRRRLPPPPDLRGSAQAVGRRPAARGPGAPGLRAAR